VTSRQPLSLEQPISEGVWAAGPCKAQAPVNPCKATARQLVPAPVGRTQCKGHTSGESVAARLRDSSSGDLEIRADPQTKPGLRTRRAVSRRRRWQRRERTTAAGKPVDLKAAEPKRREHREEEHLLRRHRRPWPPHLRRFAELRHPLPRQQDGAFREKMNRGPSGGPEAHGIPWGRAEVGVACGRSCRTRGDNCSRRRAVAGLVPPSGCVRARKRAGRATTSTSTGTSTSVIRRPRRGTRETV